MRCSASCSAPPKCAPGKCSRLQQTHPKSLCSILCGEQAHLHRSRRHRHRRPSSAAWAATCANACSVNLMHPSGRASETFSSIRNTDARLVVDSDIAGESSRASATCSCPEHSTGGTWRTALTRSACTADILLCRRAEAFAQASPKTWIGSSRASAARHLSRWRMCTSPRARARVAGHGSRLVNSHEQTNRSCSRTQRPCVCQCIYTAPCKAHDSDMREAA